MQHLDGDVAIVLEIMSEIHRRHAARAELTLDAIVAGECGREARQGIAAQYVSGMGIIKEQGRMGSNVVDR